VLDLDDLPSPDDRPHLRLFGVPVTVLPWHFILLAIFFSREIGARPLLGLALVMLGSASTLAHEMGHALSSQTFGLRPRVVLSSFGGFTQHQPARRPWQAFVIVAAGPAVSLGLWWLFGLLAERQAGEAGYVMARMSLLNLVWAIYNLLPMFPMDGGLLLHILLRGGMRSPVRADRWTLRVSLAVGVLLVAWFLRGLVSGAGGYQLLFAFVMLRQVMTNWQMLQALPDDPNELADQKHPRVRELLANARAAFGEGRFEEAVRLCHLARQEPYLSSDETAHVWQVLALASAQLARWDDALRFAERVPGSRDMAAVQAAALLSLGDRERARRFLSTPTANLLAADRLEAVQTLARS
jgi:Zn-dependent protease